MPGVAGPDFASALSRPIPEAPPSPVAMADHVLADLCSREPETWPEILREQTGVSGQLEAVQRAAYELRDRLAHVLLDPAPSAPRPDHPFPVLTPVGHRLRAQYLTALDVEDVLRDITARLAV